VLSRKFLATSSHPVAKGVREVVRRVYGFSLPAPKIVFRPLVEGYVAAREIYYFGARVLVCEPMFKAMGKQYGANLHAGSFLHYVEGKGDIILGDNVTLDGKINIAFGARYSDRPVLRIGNNTGVGHLTSFGIARQVTIGSYCRIAGGASILDLSR